MSDDYVEWPNKCTNKQIYFAEIKLTLPDVTLILESNNNVVHKLNVHQRNSVKSGNNGT